MKWAEMVGLAIRPVRRGQSSPSAGPRTAAANADDAGRRDWFEIPGEVLSLDAVIRVVKPSGINRDEVIDRLRDGHYSHPFVIDDGRNRYLHFNMRYLQSAMSIRDPHKLLLEYTRKMMAFLLFQPKPAHVIIVGLGGGSLTRACHHLLPDSRITTIEINGDVIEIARRWFAFPGPHQRCETVHVDAVDFLLTSPNLADVVLIDACDQDGVPDAMRNQRFFRTVRNRLTPAGIAVINAVGPEHHLLDLQRMMSAAFNGRLMILKVANANRLIFGLNDAHPDIDWFTVNRSASKLQRITGIDFRSMAACLKATSFDPRGVP